MNFYIFIFTFGHNKGLSFHRLIHQRGAVSIRSHVLHEELGCEHEEGDKTHRQGMEKEQMKGDMKMQSEAQRSILSQVPVTPNAGP